MLTEITEGLVKDVMPFWWCTQKEHDSWLQAVFSKLEKAGITLNLDKFEFSKKEVKFLGYIISDEGIRADLNKTAAFRENLPGSYQNKWTTQFSEDGKPAGQVNFSASGKG